MAFKNDEKVIEYILETHDNAHPRHVDDCTHRNLFDILDDHNCRPCRCGDPYCSRVLVENYCQPNFVVGASMEFAEGVEIEFDESGIPLTVNPNPLLPYDELILNG